MYITGFLIIILSSCIGMDCAWSRKLLYNRFHDWFQVAARMASYLTTRSSLKRISATPLSLHPLSCELSLRYSVFLTPSLLF